MKELLIHTILIYEELITENEYIRTNYTIKTKANHYFGLTYLISKENAVKRL